jgi:hypothetical protein
MHKYAAATALVIALNITMLAPAVSWPYVSCSGDFIGRIYCRCARQCVKDSMHDYAVAAAGTSLAREKKGQACASKCVNAAEAARR